MKNENASLKLSVLYKILGVLFAVSALVTLLGSFAKLLGIVTVIYIAYIVMDVILVYGFWKMRKWIVVLMGIATSFLLVDNVVRVFARTQEIKIAAIQVAVVGVIFLFSFLTRNQLNGQFKNVRVIRVFVGALMLAKLLFIF